MKSKRIIIWLTLFLMGAFSSFAEQIETVPVSLGMRVATLSYAEVGLPTAGWLPVFVGGKMGFVDLKGEEKMPATYEKDADALTYRFQEGFMRVKKNGLYGFIDVSLTEVIPCQFEAAENFVNGYAAVKKNGLWGFVNNKAEVVVEYGYKRVVPFFQGRAAVVNEMDSLGFVNEMGLLVIPFNYDNKENPSFNDYGFCEVWKNGKKTYITPTGNDTVVDDYLLVELKNRKNSNSIDLKEQSKKLNRTVSYELANTPYDELKTLSDGYLLALKKKNGRQFGVLSKEGREIVPCEYDNVMGPYSNHFVVEKEGKKGAVKLDGTLLLPCEYQQIGTTGTELLLVQKDDKVGFVNMKGEFVIPCQYEDARPFHGPVTAVMVRKKDKMVWNFIDKKGTVVDEPEYDDAMSFENGICPVKHKGKWGFVNESCKEIIPCKYDYSFSDYKEMWSYRYSKKGDWIPVLKEKKFGYIDLTGKVMIPFKFEEASAFLKNDLAIVQSGKKWFMDHSGKLQEFLPVSHASKTKESGMLKYTPIQLANKWGLKDESGKIVVPCIYDGVEIQGESVVVRVLNKKGLVDPETGASLIPSDEPLRKVPWIPLEEDELTLPTE